MENRDQVHSGLDKFVKLEIIVGEELTVSRIADARNTSAQVSDIALFELDDKFDLIKVNI
ncbi:MAG: AIPR family protein [Streptococcus salivarius]